MKALLMFRIRAGMTQEELAERSGVAQSLITRYERGVRRPGAATLRKLADALGVTEWEIRYAEELLERREAVEQAVEDFAAAMA